MRLSIERLRTLILVAGILLVAALVVFLILGRWRNPFNRKDLPHKLGVDIQQEANGVTYTQSRAGHTLFKIHASKVVQLKAGNALLHDVKIELYGTDGKRVDRIEGGEFEYNQKEGTAEARGPVEIWLTKPGVEPPAVAQGLGKSLSGAAQAAANGQIHVKTSGLSFNQESGIAQTSQKLDFEMAQGKGSAMGAIFDTQKESLILDHAVDLSSERGGSSMHLLAQHAEFDRDKQQLHLHAATVESARGNVQAGQATVDFRDNGSAAKIQAESGITFTTDSGSHVAAPRGLINLDDASQPHHAHLEGGVTLESTSPEQGRRVTGHAQSAELEFAAQGLLQQARLEQNVELESHEQTTGRQPTEFHRKWRAPQAEIGFREQGHHQVELARIHGWGGVVVESESRQGQGPVLPSLLAADDLTGDFVVGGVLQQVHGTGHARLEESAANGSRQKSSGDRLEVHFSASGKGSSKAQTEIQLATIEGHVLISELPAPKSGSAPQELRATGSRADYEGTGELLHLTGSPRVVDAGFELTAMRIDLARQSGDAFAHGDVKASWMSGKPGQLAAGGLGAQGPVHAIAAEAQLHKATGEAIFRGNARLWQQSNSITAPLIVLDRVKQSLFAKASSPADPVRTVLVSEASGNAKSQLPTVIRLRGGEFDYSELERRALMRAAPLSSVLAETPMATSTSNEVEVKLLPAGSHNPAGNQQLDRLYARGHVVLQSQGRRGMGEQLVYTGASGEYVLTGSAAQPPRISDPQRGNVTGTALIFEGRDDSVRVEGSSAAKTRTETLSPR